jgi:hypothetical protein
MEEARRQGVQPTTEQIVARGARFRTTRGLGSREVFDAWLAAERLTPAGFDEDMADELRLEQIRALFEPEAERQLRAVLRHEGLYGRLLARAREKQELLAHHGVGRAGSAESGLDTASLLAWYFGDVLGQPVPADAGALASSLGCADDDALLRVLRREWWFRRLAGPPAPISL